MKNDNSLDDQYNQGGLSGVIRTWHLVIIILCLSAFLTGDLADDYKKIEHGGFIIHGWLGMATAFALCLYLGYSIIGPRHSRLSQWFPFTRERLQRTGNDLATLLHLRLPEYRRHQGLAGLVQFMGLFILFWLAATGTVMYLFIDPGHKAQGALHAVKEMHEIGEVLVPVYLALHIGAVIAHSLAGNHLWKGIFFRRK